MTQAGIVKLVIVALMLGALAGLIYYSRKSLGEWYEKAVIFLKEVRVEMQKVVWPGKQDVYGATFVVMVSVIILTIAIAIEDRLLSAILDTILRLTTS